MEDLSPVARWLASGPRSYGILVRHYDTRLGRMSIVPHPMFGPDPYEEARALIQEVCETYGGE